MRPEWFSSGIFIGAGPWFHGGLLWSATGISTVAYRGFGGRSGFYGNRGFAGRPGFSGRAPAAGFRRRGLRRRCPEAEVASGAAVQAASMVGGGGGFHGGGGRYTAADSR